MIRVDMIRQDTSHPDKRRRHQGRAICEVAGQRFEARGPAPIYKLATLLWLHGHGGAKFEVYDDLSPFGRPGGLAMRGKARNWARFILRYIKSLFHGIPMLRQLIERETAETVDLSNGITIEIHTCRFRAVRGYTVVAALLDEVAFWRSDGGDAPRSSGQGPPSEQPASQTVAPPAISLGHLGLQQGEVA